MKIVFSSDWHGDAITQGVDRYDEVERSVMETVHHAIKVNADAYVFCGDLCDPHASRSHRAVALAHQVASTLRSHMIHSYWLVGNHDVIEDGSGSHTLMSLAWADNVGCIFPRQAWLQASNKFLLNIIALPFTPSSHSYDPVEFIESDKIKFDNEHPILVIGHLNLKGICAGSETLDMPRGREVFWPTNAIRAKFPKAIMVGGHYHERQVYDGVHIIGSTARLTYGEGHHKVGYLELEI